MRRRPMVAVCGGADPSDQSVLESARRLGSALCRAGFDVVCGGMGGVMEAVARGAVEARDRGEGDCLVVGILPTGDPDSANAYCDVIVPTGLGLARNILVVRAGQAVVLVDGGSGTLSEAAYAWQLGKPMVALSQTGGWAQRLAGLRIDHRRDDQVHDARDPEEAVAILTGLLHGDR